MTTNSGQRDDGNQCFVCGPQNPYGLQVSFHMDNSKCRAVYTANEYQCGYDGVVHGGILFSLLDDVMANWLYLQGERAYTGKCEIRYRNPASAGVQLSLEGEMLSRKGRFVTMSGRVTDSSANKLLAEATATFVVIVDPGD